MLNFILLASSSHVIFFLLPLHCMLRCMHFCNSLCLTMKLYKCISPIPDTFSTFQSWAVEIYVFFALTMRKNVTLLCWQTMNIVCGWAWLTKLLHFSDHSSVPASPAYPNMKKRMKENSYHCCFTLT